MGQFGNVELKSILFGSIPKHEDLCYLIGSINLSENNAASISNKAYQCQIYKCRCLIFTASEVIASPVLGAVQKIHIVISKRYHRSGKLTPHLEKLNIEVAEPQPLTNSVYEACLSYTIRARLAPSWNQVDKYLVQGRDFLLTSSPLDAVKLDIVINDVDMHIVLWPLRLRLPQVCAQDLQATTSSSPYSWNLSSNNMTVHVLPSLNKANVLMVSEHIPKNSLFKSYKDLKKHWKNSYGYRLPDSEEGILYVTVNFGRWFSESMTYPVMCVRARRPVFLRQPDPQLVLLKVLADLRVKVPAICGYPFGIEATIRYATSKLNNVFRETLFPCNLTESKPVPKKPEDTEQEDITHNESQPVTQFSRITPVENNSARNHSPPPFLPRLSQRISPVPATKPAFVPVFTPKTRIPATTTTTTKSSLSPSHPDEEEQHPTSLTVKSMFGGNPVKPIFGLAQSSPNFQTNKTLTSQFKNSNNAPFPLFGSTKHIIKPRGEKTLLHFPEGTCKKARNKPQVQPGIDVEALAHKRGGLDKVNTTTLIAYLRVKGVPCKVKDKKGDLVNKVLTHLQLPLPESPSVPLLPLPLPSPAPSTSHPANDNDRIFDDFVEVQ